MTVSGAQQLGVLVFSTGGKVWIFGEGSTSSAILMVINEDFSIASN